MPFMQYQRTKLSILKYVGISKRENVVHVQQRSMACPRFKFKTRSSSLDLEKPITVEPMKAFPLVKDLVTVVSWNI